MRSTAAPITEKRQFQSFVKSPRKSPRKSPVSTRTNTAPSEDQKQVSPMSPSSDSAPPAKIVSPALRNMNLENHHHHPSPVQTTLSDIKEESETTSGPPARQGDIGDRDMVKVSSSEVELPDTLLNGRLHYNSTSSFAGRELANQYPISVTMEEDEIRTLRPTSKSKAKNG